MTMLHAVPVMSNDLELPLAATEACGTKTATQAQVQLEGEVGTHAHQAASCCQPQPASGSVCGSAGTVICHRDVTVPVIAGHHDGTCEMHSNRSSSSHIRPPETRGAASGSWDDQPEADSGMTRLACGIKTQANWKINRPDQILAHCDRATQKLSVVDHNHDDASLAVASSRLPEGNFPLPEDAHHATGRTRVGLRVKPRASGRRAWSKGKKSSETAGRVRRVHGTTTMSVAKDAADMTFLKPNKPNFSLKRQVDRDYTKPGKFRGVRYRGKGRYSAELKVMEVRRWLGIFSSAKEAACAFDRAAFEVRGNAAKLNFPELIEGAEVEGAEIEGKDGLPAGKNLEEVDSDVLNKSICNASSETQHGGTNRPCLDSSLPYGQGEGLGAPLHGPQQILQQNSLPALKPEAQGSAYVCGDKHTMASSCTVTCAPPRILPPVSGCVHLHTHPLTARPPLWSDLDADPLEILPPSPLLSAPEADSSMVRSQVDQLQHLQAGAASAITPMMTLAQGVVMMAQQQQQQQHQHQHQHQQHQKQHQQHQQQQLHQHHQHQHQQSAKHSGVLPKATGESPDHLEGRAPGRMARNLCAILEQAPLAISLGEWAADTGVASGSGGRGSSFGLLAAKMDAEAADTTNHLHLGSSTTISIPRGTSNALPDSCAAKSR